MDTQVVKRTMERHELSILLSLLVVVSGCSTFTRRPVPESLIDSVCVPHMPRDIRTWGDRRSEMLQRSLRESFAQTQRAHGDHEPMDSRLMQDQGVGDLWQAYAACRRDGLDFCVAAIPDDEALPAEPRIDTQIQTRLFDRGYAMGRGGYPWADQPPGLRPARPKQASSAADGGVVAAECDNGASLARAAAGGGLARGVARLEDDGGRLDH